MTDEKQKPIVVIGSIVYDLVMQVEHLPTVGETVPGTDFKTFIGGKGLNQAMQIKRLGAPFKFYGRVGNDQFGTDVIEYLQKEEFPTGGINIVDGETTAVGMIYVSPGGKNMIGGYPPANMNWSVDQITDEMWDSIANASIVSLQLETPIPFNAAIAKHARLNGVTTLLNAAPWKHTPGRLAHRCDYWVVNEIEAGQFFFTKITNWQDCSKMAGCPYIVNGNRTWVVTLGDKGACVVDKTGLTPIEGLKVDGVDSTGAGDSFTGAFAVGLYEGMSSVEAAEFANRVAAKSVTKLGGMTGLPYRDEIEPLPQHSEDHA
ncbi:MAG TPA: ribokinase [bacterium]|jgi:ribokinase